MTEKQRLLCLHGGGVTGQIFERQMRHFKKSLAPHFRLVFADGPWTSEMHDDLKPVYSQMGPCRRWGRWKPSHPSLDHSSAIRQVERSLTKAMDEDEGSGEWVGLIGFSQGAKLAFSILLENQLRLQKDRRATGFAGVHWQFGVIMAGRGPPYNLGHSHKNPQHYTSVAGLSPVCESDLSSLPFSNKLQTPTLHVHGLQDGGLDMHRHLLKHFTSPAKSRLIQWYGAHRIPIQSTNVKEITEGILEMAKVRANPSAWYGKVLANTLSPLQPTLHGNLDNVAADENLFETMSIVELAWTEGARQNGQVVEI